MKINQSIYTNKIDDIYLNGFTILNSVFSHQEVKAIKDKIVNLSNSLVKPDETTIPKLNRGHDVIYNLETKDIFFIRLFSSNALISSILKELLNDSWYKQIPQDEPNYILRAMIARNGGETLLPLHIDSFIPNSGKLPFVMQLAVILDEQNVENGCTFYLPGSHKLDRYANNELDIDSVLPIKTKSGDVVIWDSRLHHGAYPNKTNTSRWSLIATFTRWWIKQNYQTKTNMPKSIEIQLTNIEKSILGYCSSPPLSEYERIDIKAGYEILK
jgi:ectoine hydroxylase-related dioxygenase (phytanoyl-CoA dioxygenase family)